MSNSPIAWVFMSGWIILVVLLVVVVHSELQQQANTPMRSPPLCDSSQCGAENLSYFKDRFGVCYAILQNMDAGGAGWALTAVPCTQVGL